jgi:hypothetical protein
MIFYRDLKAHLEYLLTIFAQAMISAYNPVRNSG